MKTLQAKRDQGRASHFLGYRPTYLILRALFRAPGELAELAMIWGFLGAALRRSPRYADPAARAYVRRQQRLRELPARAREVRGEQQAHLQPERQALQNG